MAATTTNAQFMKDRARRQGIFLSLPAVFWLGIFFILPVLIVLAISFMTPTTDGAGGQFPLTLNHYGDAFDFLNKRLDTSAFVRPISFSVASAILASIIGSVAAVWAARQPLKATRQRLMLVGSVPFVLFLLITFGANTFGPNGSTPLPVFVPVGDVIYALKMTSSFIITIPVMAFIFAIIPALLIYSGLRSGQPENAGIGSPSMRQIIGRVIVTFVPTLFLVSCFFAIPELLNPRPVYSAVIVRSVYISLLTTLICLLMGYPLSFFIATRKNQYVRQFAMFLIIMPFWTNFLVRTYALKTIIAPEGTLAGILNAVGGLGLLQNGKLTWLNTREAVILGLVYSYLPFMVLPIYAVVEKFDFRFVEAANDLGANDWKTLIRVVIPMTAPGLVAGFILVFIPTIGAFVTPDLLGGTQGLMISNLIQQNIRGSGANYPRGSALSAVLMILVTIGVVIYLRYGDREAVG